MKTCVLCGSTEGKTWYKGPKCQKCYSKVDYEKRKTIINARCRQYYKENSSQILEKKLEYYYSNHSKIKSKKRDDYYKDLENSRKQQREWRNSNKNTPTYRFGKAKYSAKLRELTFDIQIEDYARLISTPCSYCFTDLIAETGVGLDRIDNNKGYSIDNVLPCCGDCNQLRGDRLTVEETKVAVNAVLKYRNSSEQA